MNSQVSHMASPSTSLGSSSGPGRPRLTRHRQFREVLKGKTLREFLPCFLHSCKAQRSWSSWKTRDQWKRSTRVGAIPISRSALHQPIKPLTKLGLGRGAMWCSSWLLRRSSGVRNNKEENVRDPGETLQPPPPQNDTRMVLISPERPFSPYQSPTTPSTPISPSPIRFRAVGLTKAEVPATDSPQEANAWLNDWGSNIEWQVKQHWFHGLIFQDHHQRLSFLTLGVGKLHQKS